MGSITQERLKSLLDYSPETGEFVWLVTRGRFAKPGSKAGSLDAHGYVCIRVDGKTYKAHRLAWLYVNGEFPNGLIDHVNKIRNDNRIANLRVADASQNRQNIKKPANNSSGYTGIHWHKQCMKWVAHIKVNGKMIYLGIFSDLDDALSARASAKKTYHPFHPED